MSEILFETRQNDKVGRFAVASCALKAGEVFLKEKPFAFGPKSDTPPSCLGCYIPVDCSVRCTRCNWPVCDKTCEDKPAHKDAECQVFSENSVKFQVPQDTTASCPQYECIMPLRMLLAKERDPQRWDSDLKQMQTHIEDRIGTDLWRVNQINIVNYLRGPCKLDRFDEQIVHHVCGILDVNSFEARAISGYGIRCLYPKLAIASHNCVPNTAHSIVCTNTGGEDDYWVSARVTVGVEKGQELFASYTYSLWPTIVRREFLKASKYFHCDCARCADPTELGSHTSTIKCMKCDDGFILCKEPLVTSSPWRCNICGYETPGEAVRKAFSVIQNEIDAIEGLQDSTGLEAREKLSRKYRSVLHPTNAYHMILNTSLSQLYGRVDGYTMEDLPDILLERKVELCRNVLRAIDIVEPGCTRIRGITLYEMHAPLILLAKNLYISNCIDKEALRKKFQEAADVLEMACVILRMEPEETAEGHLGSIAEKNLQELNTNLEMLIEIA